MHKQTTTQEPIFSEKPGFHRVTFALLSAILVLSVMTSIFAPTRRVTAQEPTPTLPLAVWETPVGGAQPLPGETDWTLIGLIAAVVVIILALLVLLIVFFLRSGRRKPRGHPLPGAGAMASLTIQAGPGAGQRFTLSKPVTMIGRHVESDVVIQHPEVSRRHASITCEGGAFVLRDLGSNNGTFVNRQRLSRPHALRDGDVIMLGTMVQLVFRRQ